MRTRDVISSRFHLHSFWIAFTLALIEIGWALVSTISFFSDSESIPFFLIVVLFFSSALTIGILFGEDKPTQKTMSFAAVIASVGIAVSLLGFGSYFIAAFISILGYGIAAPWSALFYFLNKEGFEYLHYYYINYSFKIGIGVFLIMVFSGPSISKKFPQTGLLFFYAMIFAMILGTSGCVETRFFYN